LGRINQEIVEYSFSQKATLSYELNVLVGSDSIYYIINDAQLNVLILKSFHFDHQNGISLTTKLNNVFIDDPILRESFGATRIVLTTPHFTLVPTKFFNENERRTYFNNLTELSQDVAIEADTLRNIDFKNLYTVDIQLLKQVITLFPNARIHHYMSPLILGCQHIAEHIPGHQVFANVRDGIVQLLFFDGHNLIFANSYPFKTPQDFIYFILLVYEQFKLNPENIPLSLSGALTESSELYRFAYRFIRHIQWISIPPYFQLGNQFAGVPPHFYFDIFSIKLCE
jgi:Protein of unknown function (DUF3822)